jgi:hypothetical protein
MVEISGGRTVGWAKRGAAHQAFLVLRLISCSIFRRESSPRRSLPRKCLVRGPGSSGFPSSTPFFHFSTAALSALPLAAPPSTAAFRMDKNQSADAADSSKGDVHYSPLPAPRFSLLSPPIHPFTYSPIHPLLPQMSADSSKRDEQTLLNFGVLLPALPIHYSSHSDRTKRNCFCFYFSLFTAQLLPALPIHYSLLTLHRSCSSHSLFTIHYSRLH